MCFLPAVDRHDPGLFSVWFPDVPFQRLHSEFAPWICSKQVKTHHTFTSGNLIHNSKMFAYMESCLNWSWRYTYWCSSASLHSFSSFRCLFSCFREFSSSSSFSVLLLRDSKTFCSSWKSKMRSVGRKKWDSGNRPPLHWKCKMQCFQAAHVKEEKLSFVSFRPRFVYTKPWAKLKEKTGTLGNRAGLEISGEPTKHFWICSWTPPLMMPLVHHCYYCSRGVVPLVKWLNR